MSFNSRMLTFLKKYVGRIAWHYYDTKVAIYRAAYRIRRNIRRQIIGTPKQIESSTLLYSSRKPDWFNDWIYHDERWIRVMDRSKHRRLVAAGIKPQVVDNRQNPTGEVLINNGTIDFTGIPNSKDKWFYLYLDPATYAWRDHSFKIAIRRDTDFREFQFGFRYRDFYNRYRFRLESDHIFFDKVTKGKFYNRLGAAPFKMVHGVTYELRVDITGNRYRCFIDGKPMLDEFDFSAEFESGSIAIILWEHDGVTPISAGIGPIEVRELIAASG